MQIQAWTSSHPPKVGTLLTIDHPVVAEVARLAGFDWLWIDAEHGRFNELSASIACAVLAGGPPAFVRLPDHSPTAIKRYLEVGADGIILPQVSTVEEVNAIARAALYPPRGERSVGIGRAQGYGSTFSEYLRTRSYSILVQIETVEGLRNVEQIVAHPAVDGVIVGPYDLSGSFGIAGEIDAPAVKEGIAAVLAVCKRAAKPCGIFAAGAEKARAYADLGFQFLGVGLDTTILMGAYKSLLAATRQ